MLANNAQNLLIAISKFSGKWLWVNFADFGEEIDDEAHTVFTSQALRAFGGSLDAITLTVNGKMTSEARLRSAHRLGLDELGVSILPINNFDISLPLANLHRYEGLILQQNAPLGGDDLQHVDRLVSHISHARKSGLKSVMYMSQGTFGKCVNTGGDALQGANLLKTVADNGCRFCTDSTANLSLTHNICNLFPSRLADACRIGYVKKLLGRAPPIEQTRHLVGEPAPGVANGSRGANAQSVKQLFEEVYEPLKDSSVTDWATIPSHTEWPRAWKAAAGYCEVRPGVSEDALEFSQSKRVQLGQTHESQVDGLARMQVAFHLLYQTPVDEIYYSSDPEWDSCAESGKFKKHFDRITEAVKRNPDVAWSPMYDPTCGLALVSCLVGEGGMFFEDAGYADDDVRMLKFVPTSVGFGELLSALASCSLRIDTAGSSV